MRIKGKRWVIPLTLVVFLSFLVGCGGNTPSDPPPDQEQVVYVEDFSDPKSGWMVSTTEKVERRYTEDGKYEIEAITPGFVYYSPAPSSKVPVLKPPYSVEVEIELRQGEGYGGLFFDRYAVGEGTAEILFEVSPYDEYYKVEKYHPESGWESITNWVPTAEGQIKSGVNKLKVTRDASDKACFYINGEKVFESESLEFPSKGSRFGVVAAVDKDPLESAVFQFDNFKLSGKKF